jgi:methionine-rich copper-binding protein CopC
MKQKLSGYRLHAAILFVGQLLLPALAMAHTHLVSSEPGKNEVIKTVIQAVTLKLSEDVEPKFSKIEVTETATKVRADEGEVKQTEQGKNTLTVSLKHLLKAGKYHVNWKATSVDTHKSHGEYDFTYAPKE